jgi:hypothetical protein
MVALMHSPMRIGPETGAERRMFPRKEIHAQVEGKRLDHTVEARISPRLDLALRALSFGERLTVIFPPLGDNRGWDAYGRVIRCEPSSVGYRIAVEFDPLPAA